MVRRNISSRLRSHTRKLGATLNKPAKADLGCG
jgi:hypothetical protein